MLELHQFRHSTFCLKVRMSLEAKGLNYIVREIRPGLGQLALFRLSGQRQVPVLVDGPNVLTDSSVIIRHLDTLTQEPQLVPNNPQEAAQAHLLEDWADTTLARAVRLALFQAASNDPTLRIALLPEDVPEYFQKVLRGVPCGLIVGLSEILSQGELASLLTSLEQLSRLVESQSWLIGEKMSIADIALAAQLSLLKFPQSSGKNLYGKGCPGFLDNPALTALFNWRDQLECQLFQKNSSAS